MRKSPLLSTLLPALVSAVLAPLVAGSAAAASLPEPRPIAPWEPSAVELALAYMDGGAGPWWPRLAAGSPLAARGRAAAAGEIAARIGPPELVGWRLLTPLDEGTAAARSPCPPPSAVAVGEPPRCRLAAFQLELASGLDDLLLLALVEPVGPGEGWQLWSLAGWAEPPGGLLGAASVPPAAAVPPATVPPAAAQPSAAGLSRSAPPVALAVLAAFALLIAAGLLRSRRRAVPLSLLAVAVAAIWLACQGSGGGERAAGADGGSPEDRGAAVPGDFDTAPLSVADLVELRDRLAAGDPLPAPHSQETGGDGGRSATAVARLWRAQRHLTEGDLQQAEELLAGFPQPAEQPLAAVLRARLAFLRGDEVTAVLAYEHARQRLPAIDGLLLEEAEALDLLGYQDQARRGLELLVRRGSREAAARYRLSRFAAAAGQIELAGRLFRQAWQLEPMERHELLTDPLLAYLVRKGDLFDLLALDRAEEPAPVPPGLGRQALTLPAALDGGAGGPLAADHTGATLWLHPRGAARGGGAELVVPGGTALAPPSAVAIDPAARRRQRERRALAEVDRAAVDRARAGAAAGPGAAGGQAPEAAMLTRPALRQRLTDAAVALARGNRWHDLLALTDRPAARPASLPTDLARLRAEALHRAGRHEEAARLLVLVAMSNAAEGRRDPQALFHLADQLVEVGEFERAMRVARRAEAQLPEPSLVSLVPKIRLEQRLATSYETHSSRHFKVRFPARTPRVAVERLTGVLELELERLQPTIPHRPAAPIEIHLFPFDDFFEHYSQGGTTLGLYDGKVRLPLAEQPSLHPSIVALMTHEVAHALIAGATRDLAPAWFHEGLAQHVQMVQEQPNPIPGYRERGKLVALPLLEPILSSYSDPELTALAYDEAAWVLHYLEAEHGRRAIRRLLDAFRRGLDTEAAVREVLGMTPAQLDEAVWRWSDKVPVWRTDVIRYDEE